MKKSHENKHTNFHIQNFMLKLGLSLNEMSVYALIYSFTQGEIGVFYGSQQYVADTLGISRRTVVRIFNKLYREKLIEKYESKEKKVKGVRALMPQNDALQEKEEKEEEEILLSPTPPRSVAEIEETLPHRVEKYAPIEIPGCETLSLSAAQYIKLRELVTSDVLYGYARRFDRYMYKRLEKMLPSPRSHYQVIKSWIEKDFST